jgi:DNA-binding CsgD family transcriptional regulator
MGLVEVRAAVSAAVDGHVSLCGPSEHSAKSPPIEIHPRSPLTRKQRRLLGLLRQGLPRAEIARRLGVSLSGVDAAKTRLRQSFGLARGEQIDWQRVGFD